jgi:high-affinity iron transporter
MDAGHFLANFLILFREALEACLIIGIILTVLDRLNQKRFFPHVLISATIAILTSVVAGFLLVKLTAHAQEEVQELIEGIVNLLACGVLTYMIFWMDRQASRIKPEIESQLEVAISRQDYIVMITLPFLAVFREGAETVLFLIALSGQSQGGISWVGSLTGLLLAVGICLFIFIGGKRVPLKLLFKGSSLFLLFIAAGLLMGGIHEFHELHIIPEIYAPVWNLNPILDEKVGVGMFLKAIFGYNADPSIVEVAAYGTYFSFILWLLYKRSLFSPSPQK